MAKPKETLPAQQKSDTTAPAAKPKDTPPCTAAYPTS
jgi:hypothetical protein